MHERIHRSVTLVRPAGVACSLIFSVGMVLFSTKAPSPDIWKAGEPLLIGLIMVGVATALYQCLVNLDQHQRSTQATLDDACREMAAHLDEACPHLALRFIGVHIWRVTGIGRAKRLVRAGQFLIRPRASSSVRWTKGKGAVGLTWKEEAPVLVDLDAMYAQATSKATWESLPEQSRLGLRWDEKERTSLYKAIYATPLLNVSSTKVIGALAIDVLESGHFVELESATKDNERFNGILGLCQDALRDA